MLYLEYSLSSVINIANSIQFTEISVSKKYKD